MTALASYFMYRKRLKGHAICLKDGIATVADDIAQGLFDITHSSFALLGLVVVFAVVTLSVRPDLREAGESQLITWLQERRDAIDGVQSADADDETEAPASSRPRVLSSQQVAVALWLSKKYAVAQEPVGVLVAEAFEIGRRAKLDPTLILAVMAIESGFNPFAQSPVGAQGLMQVMTRVHVDKYENFGGKLAAFDPVTNLRVGVKVLQECITRAGSIEGGLKHYVGAANLASDGGYAGKVLAEHARLQAVAGTKRLLASGVVTAPAKPVAPQAPQPVETASVEKVALVGTAEPTAR